MSYLLYYFGEMIRWGFTISFPLIIGGHMLKKEWQVFTKQWLKISYAIVLSSCAITLADNITGFIQRSKFVNETNGYNFYYMANYGVHFIAYVLLLTLLTALFLHKRIRHSFGWGALSLLVLHYEVVYMAIWSLYRDYLPSSWSMSYNPFPFDKYVFSFIAFNALAYGIYFLSRLRIISPK